MRNSKLEEIVDKLYTRFPKTVDYLSDRERLKAIAVLGGCIAGLAYFREKLPTFTEYFRDKFPSLSDETISLGVDTLANTIGAPIGFVASSYVNNANINKKELAGQVAFAIVWGAIRHYVYEGLSNFDDITLSDASLKTGLYTAYYAAYGALYVTFSDFLHRISHGEPVSKAAGVLKRIDMGNRFRAISLDAKIQFNLALNIANMFNPWVESRPTAASVLLIDYNMSILRHSHKRVNDAWSYLKKTFLDYSYNNKNGASSQ